MFGNVNPSSTILRFTTNRETAEPSDARRAAESSLLKWLIARRGRVIRTVRLATSRSLVHSPSSADQFRRLSLWLDLGPLLVDATSVS